MTDFDVRGSLPEPVRRSLTETHYGWRTADGVAKDSGLDVTEAVSLLEGSPDIQRASEPNARGRALYRLKPKETFLVRLLGALANSPA